MINSKEVVKAIKAVTQPNSLRLYVKEHRSEIDAQLKRHIPDLKRPIHAVYEWLPGRPYVCNKNKVTLGTGRNDYTRLPNLPLFAVTCKNCLRVLRCGTQTTLVLK